VSEQTSGTQNAEATAEKADNTKDAANTDANASGASNGETGGGTSSEFKPITSEAELSSWKDATRKDMVATITKDVQARIKREADEAAAKEKGEFETLATKRQERIDELERDIAERDRRELRAKVARTHKLPADLAALLQGDDEGALTESAKLLAKHIKPVAAPDTEAGVGAGVTPSADTSRPIRKDDGKQDKQPAFTYEGKEKIPWRRTT
jgi:hypothetical protein